MTDKEAENIIADVKAEIDKLKVEETTGSIKVKAAWAKYGLYFSTGVALIVGFLIGICV